MAATASDSAEEGPVMILSRDILVDSTLKVWRKTIHDRIIGAMRKGLFEAFFEFEESKALSSSDNAKMWSKYFYELFDVAESHGLKVYQRRDPYTTFDYVDSKESFQYWGPTTTLCVSWV